MPDELLKQHILLDPFLKPHQAQFLLQLICHMQSPHNLRKHRDTTKTIGNIIEVRTAYEEFLIIKIGRRS